MEQEPATIEAQTTNFVDEVAIRGVRSYLRHQLVDEAAKEALLTVAVADRARLFEESHNPASIWGHPPRTARVLGLGLAAHRHGFLYPDKLKPSSLEWKIIDLIEKIEESPGYIRVGYLYQTLDTIF